LDPFTYELNELRANIFANELNEHTNKIKDFRINEK